LKPFDFLTIVSARTFTDTNILFSMFNDRFSLSACFF